MLHVDEPERREVKKTIVEYVIPLHPPMDRTGFLWLVNKIDKNVRDARGGYNGDDAYYVSTGDDELIFAFEVRA